MRLAVLLTTMVSTTFVLAGCGGGGTLDDIRVSGGASPTVRVDGEVTTDRTASRIIADGDAETLVEGDSVKVHYIGVNGRTGKEFDNSYSTESPMIVTLTEQSTLPGFLKGLVGQRIGARVLVTVPASEGVALMPAPGKLGLDESDTMVFLFDLLAKVPSGEPRKAPPHAPRLTYDADDHPRRFVATKRTRAAVPAHSDSYALIEGDGDPVGEESTVTVQYLAQEYPAGSIIAETWSTGPRRVALDEDPTSRCWHDALPGHTVGSRLVVVCPEGDPGPATAVESHRPTGPLIYAIDVLDAD